nr:MAG TPA: hypothetical protein [Caudoviricetes sp.]
MRINYQSDFKIIEKNLNGDLKNSFPVYLSDSIVETRCSLFRRTRLQELSQAG